MGKSNYLENEVLKLSLGLTLALTVPATFYLALYTTTPGEDGTGGVEVSGGAYARQSIAGKFPTPSGTGSVASNANIDFGTSTASWGTIVGWGILTASSGGTLLRFGNLASSISVPSGSPVVVPSGSVNLAED